MMYGVKKFSLVSAAFGLTMLVACGDESTTKSTEQDGISVLEAGQSMSECDSESAGNMVYAADSAAFYYCADGKWTSLNDKDGAGCSVGAPSSDKDGNTVVLVTCGETSKTLIIPKGEKGDTGADCAVGVPSTDKDGNTVVAVTCGETSKTLTMPKGGEGDIGAGCSVGTPSTDKDGNTVVAVTCGETSKTLTIPRGDKGDQGETGGCKAEDKDNGEVLVTCGEGDRKTEVTLFKAVCGAESYEPTEAFCYEGEIYSCGNKPYNPAKQYCLTLEDENGAKETIEELLIDNRDKNNVQVYKTVKIGFQTWMAENLNYVPTNVSSMGDYAWSGCYDNESANCSKYGRLYTWNVAMDNADCAYEHSCGANLNPETPVRGVCPEGWHLPSHHEFGELINMIDPAFVYPNDASSSTAGKYLKSESGWNSSGDGTDAYGFSALPGGYYFLAGDFTRVGNDAYFWSSDENGDNNAFCLYLNSSNESAHLGGYTRYAARSVRCLKDND